ncbi:hypothetical protein LAV_00185 [Sphingobium phage Lacusarx]|uniref:Uncharacterized protein n=1 Tax=Sphingobium phage Lacusarx TaxID=1980139 RepID=A0A1W6DX22_9CAUD|nr:hypothetical protein FDH44_gp118 [Sphingobium phage Lacusarx]ARK07560.1 hypothetical protein LAV_00185 [Sphingobium phage Lacusarx]
MSAASRNWDEEGHTADAIRDAMLAIGKGVINFDQSRDAAALIIAHVNKFRPAQPNIPAEATPEMIDAGLTTGSRFGRSAMANIWRTMHRAAGR